MWSSSQLDAGTDRQTEGRQLSSVQCLSRRRRRRRRKLRSGCRMNACSCLLFPKTYTGQPLVAAAATGLWPSSLSQADNNNCPSAVGMTTGGRSPTDPRQHSDVRRVIAAAAARRCCCLPASRGSPVSEPPGNYTIGRHFMIGQTLLSARWSELVELTSYQTQQPPPPPPPKRELPLKSIFAPAEPASEDALIKSCEPLFVSRR